MACGVCPHRMTPQLYLLAVTVGGASGIHQNGPALAGTTLTAQGGFEVSGSGLFWCHILTTCNGGTHWPQTDVTIANAQ
jgi:hypothetical protein